MVVAEGVASLMKSRMIFGVKSIVMTVVISVAVALLSPIVCINTPTAQAADCTAAEDTNLLSFPVWYRGLNCSDGHIDLQGEEIGNVVIIVALNVVDIVLRLLSIVAIGFIIYGGFQYLIARGEPANMAKGKATITHAVVGLIIGIASAGIVGFISTRIS